MSSSKSSRQPGAKAPSASESKGKAQKQSKALPKVNAALQGFDIGIDRFGTVQSSLPVDRLNRFLDRSLKDRKLEDRDAGV